METIKSLYVDIEKGKLQINGKDVTEPIVLTLQENDGWGHSKIINYEKLEPKQTPAMKLEISLENKGMAVPCTKSIELGE